ncbi:phage integrase N-terminal domain-containing protein [Kineobactrum salinum]|uniref:phage integrase N-terminal domain-containing protein n=1 Tax=Kineobactrum salinum TaxID=2708301 RepID=UPI001E5F4050|nr:phage integrase N-terminal domain-containing protein [Kineobactrum salinum]
MRDLNYQLKMLCRHSHEGSFETRVGRERQLTAIANQLHELGFRQLQATSLKQKHVRALVEHWRGRNLSPGTIKNRMSCLRWWAEKVNKRAVVAGSNDFYGIPDRQFVSDDSKAKGLAREQLDQVKDEHVRMSLRLQQAFGLRREEALKIRPRWADRGDHLHLKASWTKGGRERTVPIRTREQRALLEQAKRLAGVGALIPGVAAISSSSESTSATRPMPASLKCTVCATPMPSSATWNSPAGRHPTVADPIKSI